MVWCHGSLSAASQGSKPAWKELYLIQTRPMRAAGCQCCWFMESLKPKHTKHPKAWRVCDLSCFLRGSRSTYCLIISLTDSGSTCPRWTCSVFRSWISFLVHTQSSKNSRINPQQLRASAWNKGRAALDVAHVWSDTLTGAQQILMCVLEHELHVKNVQHTVFSEKLCSRFVAFHTNI